MYYLRKVDIARDVKMLESATIKILVATIYLTATVIENAPTPNMRK